jgi:hypothetical protein
MAFLWRAGPTLARRPTSAPCRSADDRRMSRADAKRFPFNNFTHCFTLFSKYFSSFDHSTCLLSVSRRYLALDGIYHPFRAAFPNNPTLRGRGAGTSVPEPQTGFSPSMTSCSKEIEPGTTSAIDLFSLQLQRSPTGFQT